MNVTGLVPNSYSLQPAAGGREMLQFTYLQGLDVLTTMAFLLAGVAEANPVVRVAMELAGGPALGLVGVKVAAMLLGLFCWRTRRVGMLKRVNVFFSLLVVWNLCCLILGLAGRQAH